MQTMVERGCGLDVHQATVVACLLMVLKNGKVQKQIRTFGTTTRELVSLREWLLSEGCTHVAMESTGVYWKPIYATQRLRVNMCAMLGEFYNRT
jgi:transposase